MFNVGTLLLEGTLGVKLLTRQRDLFTFTCQKSRGTSWCIRHEQVHKKWNMHKTYFLQLDHTCVRVPIQV